PAGAPHSSVPSFPSTTLFRSQSTGFLNHINLNPEFSDVEREDMKAQARFLRAYFYWVLLRTFGPVPIVPDEGIDYTESYDDIAQPRNSYEECAEYLAQELADAAQALPMTRGIQHITRPTKGAALALRARILLFAASPLYNGKAPADVAAALVDKQGNPLLPDRKSTRLNSSHVKISYAVFCLKKKIK